MIKIENYTKLIGEEMWTGPNSLLKVIACDVIVKTVELHVRCEVINFTFPKVNDIDFYISLSSTDIVVIEMRYHDKNGMIRYEPDTINIDTLKNIRLFKMCLSKLYIKVLC